jgi:hypothetical protein
MTGLLDDRFFSKEFFSIWCHSFRHHQNCIAKIGRSILAYPSGKNDPINSMNKTIRQIFDWVKIGGVINSRSPWILPMGN